MDQEERDQIIAEYKSATFEFVQAEFFQFAAEYGKMTYRKNFRSESFNAEDWVNYQETEEIFGIVSREYYGRPEYLAREHDGYTG